MVWSGLIIPGQAQRSGSPWNCSIATSQMIWYTISVIIGLWKRKRTRKSFGRDSGAFLCFHVKRCRVIPVIPILCLIITRKSLYLLAFLALFSCDTSCDICPENRRFLSLFCFRFVRPENTKKPHKHWIFQQLCGLSKSGAEGNRTPVRKSIPCSSTIIAGYLTFPPPHENRHPCGFSSFMIRPYTQSLMYVVSHIVDARFLMCECTKADSST